MNLSSCRIFSSSMTSFFSLSTWTLYWSKERVYCCLNLQESKFNRIRVPSVRLCQEKIIYKKKIINQERYILGVKCDNCKYISMVYRTTKKKLFTQLSFVQHCSLPHKPLFLASPLICIMIRICGAFRLCYHLPCFLVL